MFQIILVFLLLCFVVSRSQVLREPFTFLKTHEQQNYISPEKFKYADLDYGINLSKYNHIVVNNRNIAPINKLGFAPVEANQCCQQDPIGTRIKYLPDSDIYLFPK